MNSVTEAASRGVPLICIPLFAEQKRNAVMVQYRKIGIMLEKPDIMAGKLYESLRLILDKDRLISMIF